MHLPRPSPPRRRGRLLAAGLICTAGVALSACGAEQPAPVTILNTEKVELAIEHSSMTQRGQHADVSCPSGVHQQKGLGFSCTAVVKGHATRFAIAQLDGSGRVRYEAR
jgi:Domain of unknown function (DUF4333)